MTRSLKNTTFAEPRPEALMDNFMAAAPPPPPPPPPLSLM